MDTIKPVVPGLEPYELEIGAGQPQYAVLPALRGIDGRVMSRWRPNEDERRALLAGADIYLTIYCGNNLYPPTHIAIMEEPNADFVRHDMRLDDAMEIRLMGQEINSIAQEVLRLKSIHDQKLGIYQARKSEIEHRVAEEGGGQ